MKAQMVMRTKKQLMVEMSVVAEVLVVQRGVDNDHARAVTSKAGMKGLRMNKPPMEMACLNLARAGYNSYLTR